jgi:hypothetical protein
MRSRWKSLLSKALPLVVSTAGLLLLLQSPGAAGPTVATGRAKPVVAKPWTAARVRTFVLELQRSIDKLVDQGHEGMADKKVVGKCYGQDATAFLEAKQVEPVLAARVTGKALPCYLASYFGCRVGDWFALAGVAATTVGKQPFTKSKVTVVEQTADHVVADVREVDGTILTAGAIDTGRGGATNEPTVVTRYEFVRDGKGVWKISDRQVTFKEWECRPR